MTEELLSQANALRNRIKDVEKLLDQLDLTDPSGVDDTVRISPIVIHAGMAQTVQFDVLPNNTDVPITEMQRLDARMHSYITQMLRDYKNQLQSSFANLT